MGLYLTALLVLLGSGRSLANAENHAPTEAVLTDIFCEGVLLAAPLVKIRMHVFADPPVVLVEIAGTHRRQTVLINAEDYRVLRIMPDLAQPREILRIEFEGGSLEMQPIGQGEVSSASLLLTGQPAKDLNSGRSIPSTSRPVSNGSPENPASTRKREAVSTVTVPVQCHGLVDPGPDLD